MKRTVRYEALAMALVVSLGVSLQAQAESKPREIRYGPYHGLKKTVAVARFDANGAFLSRYGGYEAGGGLEAQLASELARTNRFIVVERADLMAVLKEHELSLEGLTTRQAPRVGRLVGAQLLIRGSVTEFKEGRKGGGAGIGINVGGARLGFGPRSRKSRVTIDLRVIDASTGQVIAAATASGKARQTAWAVKVADDDLSFSTDGFSKTALGQASRAAIQQAVYDLVAQMDEVSWEGLVAQVRDHTVYLNAGENANLKVGQTLHCYRVMESIADPATGQILGVEEQLIGEVRVVKVQPRYSAGMFMGRWQPKAGDTVRFAGR